MPVIGPGTAAVLAIALRAVSFAGEMVAVAAAQALALTQERRALAEMRAVLLERDAGLVLGSRYLPGGGTVGWSATRLPPGRVGCGASRLALALPFSDLSGGLKMWRADTLSAIEPDELLSAGYAFQVETTQLAHLAGERIEELPFVFSERVAGASKMTLRISLEGHSRDARPAPPPPPGTSAPTCRGLVAFDTHAPVAQLDRAPPSGGGGHRFESCRAR